MNCRGNPEVHFRGHGYSNRSYITLQGCTSSHTLSPLTAMYTSCISATFKRKPGEGVGHDLTNHTSLSSRFIAYSGSIRGEIRPGCRSRPQTMCTGFSSHQTGNRYTVPRTCRITTHPEGQRCARPPVSYKHQKLVATPGQRSRVINKPRGSIGFGPNAW